MTLKSYFTHNVQSAMRQALAELGEDAVLLGVTRSSAESASPGAFEVVFGVPDAPPVSAAPKQTETDKREPLPGSGLETSTLHDLRVQLQQLRSLIRLPAGEFSRSPGVPAAARPLHQQLTQAGFDPNLASDLLSLAACAAPPQDGKELISALRTEMESMLQPWRKPANRRGSPLVMSFVGPPGAGKTLSLLKIAIQLGVVVQKKVKIFFLRDHRVGTSSLLRHYASLLDLDCRPIHGNAEFPAVDMHLAKASDLVLLDVPGFAPSEAGHMNSAAALLARCKPDETHLVLPATLHGEDLRATIERFAVFRPSALLFTRLDETIELGRVYTAAHRCGYPLSYFATGQQVPGDLVQASVGEILDRIIRKDGGALRTAA